MKPAKGAPVYDPTEDISITPGIYPAHVSDFAVNNYKGNLVYNLTYKVAPSVAEMEIPQTTRQPNGQLLFVHEDGKEENPHIMVSGKPLVGRKVKGEGIWYTPAPGEGENWKNRNYHQNFDAIGVKFPTDKNDNPILAEVEKSDVIGAPVLIHVAEHSYVKDGETKYTINVKSVTEWDDGKRLKEAELSDEEPLPF